MHSTEQIANSQYNIYIHDWSDTYSGVELSDMTEHTRMKSDC